MLARQFKAGYPFCPPIFEIAFVDQRVFASRMCTRKTRWRRANAEMEATHDWTQRKKIAPNTACWDCYRNHCDCDGLRPCKRCVDRGKATSCRDPAPSERIPRKRSKDRGTTSCTLTKQKGIFFIVDPQSFLSSKPPVINNETCITSLSSFPTATSNRSPTSLPPARKVRCEIESTRINRSVADTQPRFTHRNPARSRHPPSRFLTPRQATRIIMQSDIPPSLDHHGRTSCRNRRYVRPSSTVRGSSENNSFSL